MPRKIRTAPPEKLGSRALWLKAPAGALPGGLSLSHPNAVEVEGGFGTAECEGGFHRVFGLAVVLLRLAISLLGPLPLLLLLLLAAGGVGPAGHGRLAIFLLLLLLLLLTAI